MKILFTTPVLEYPAAGGPELRIINSIKALNIISELHLISRVSKTSIGGDLAEKYFKKNCYEFEYSPSVYKKNEILIIGKIANLKFKLKNYSKYIFINYCFELIYSFYIYLLKKKKYKIFTQDVLFIKKYITNQKIDIVWFGYGNISFDLMKELKRLFPKIKMVCDTDSVWSRFILRELDLETDISRRQTIEKLGMNKEYEEREWVKFMNITTAVSEVDAEYYRSIADNSMKIKIFSNVIDVAMYRSLPDPPLGFKKPCIYLAGTFGHKFSPMDRAAKWVIEEILPLVKIKIPDIHFYMIGKGSDIIWGDINNSAITVTGKLPTVLPYLCNADVALVPLKFESGTRFKIMEAGICCVPIVSTTLGAEGIPLVNGKDILIADTTLEFAEAIIKLIVDKNFAREISQNCKKVIEEKYSIAQLENEGNKILKYLKDC